MPPPPPPRTTTFSAYERSVGFASIAIVVVCGRCVLHRLGSTTYKHPCLNSGRSISGILARPLPKVSFCCLSLAQPTIEGSPPRLSPLPQTPPTPHYPSPRTTQIPNLPPAAVTTIIHHSLFIIHYSLNKKSAPFQTTDLDIKFQCKIKVCRPPVT